MARPKTPEKDQLKHSIRIRVNIATYNRLNALLQQTSCRSICELVRKILAKEHITFLHKDVSMNGVMEELALIRKEIKSIGININQQTHHFHISQSAAERSLYVNRTAGLYQQVDGRIDKLLKIVHQLAEVWLRK